jgi:hypothetical protein
MNSESSRSHLVVSLVIQTTNRQLRRANVGKSLGKIGHRAAAKRGEHRTTPSQKAPE